MTDLILNCLFFVLLLIGSVIMTLTFVRLFMKFSIKRCVSKASMFGKVVIVTGANHGIGYYTAKDMASRGARVILACRNEARAVLARNDIVSETGNVNVVYKPLDLSSLQSVRRFVKDFQETEGRLDVLINNAGVHGLSQHTIDGIVEGMQVNYFAPFLLTLLLLPILIESKGRIVNVSSLCHHLGEVNLVYLNEPGYYSDVALYANSKLCMISFTLELSRRLRDTGVVANAVHPGVIKTNIVKEDKRMLRFWFKMWCWICCRTAEEGAQTLIYLAAAEECANVTGKYLVDCKERWISWKATNLVLAMNLWRLSEELVGYTGEKLVDIKTTDETSLKHMWRKLYNF